MDEKVKTARNQAGGGKCADDDDVMVNDSLGTTTLSDSSGSDEDKETGDAKDQNLPTRED